METNVEELYGSADYVVTPSGVKVELFSGEEVRALSLRADHELVQIVDWAENFLGKPSHLVGRTGNVCPFVPEAMTRGSLKFAVIFLRNRGLDAVNEIEETIFTFREHFVAKEKALGKIDIFGSTVMIFPDVTKEEAPTVIDPSQRKLKPTFVKEGLMLGEFHPFSPTPGLRNLAFRPLRSPIPLLAIRHMVESDVDFMMAPSDPAETRVQSLKAYLQFLGPSLSVASQVKAKQALKLAESQMGQV